MMLVLAVASIKSRITADISVPFTAHFALKARNVSFGMRLTNKVFISALYHTFILFVKPE